MHGRVAIAFNPRPARRAFGPAPTPTPRPAPAFPTRRHPMRRTAATFPLIGFALLLAACSSPATTAASQPASPAATQASSPSSAGPGASSAAATQPAVTTSLDPCQLVTSSEASSLAATTYGPGQVESSGQNGKRCVYGSGTTNVFMVEVGQAASAAAARADWSAEQARAQALIEEAARRDQPVRPHHERPGTGRPGGRGQRFRQRRRADARPERDLPPQGRHLPGLPGRSPGSRRAQRGRPGSRGADGPVARALATLPTGGAGADLMCSLPRSRPPLAGRRLSGDDRRDGGM